MAYYLAIFYFFKATSLIYFNGKSKVQLLFDALSHLLSSSVEK